MINNNKILTVSYGTFSCKLEGFDDSFGTMKAIAEYFRDLSADDRYFGAEPAQPDAQMLACIAEREISRHAEAREDKGRIVLAAQDSDSVADDAPTVLEKPTDTAEDKPEPQSETEGKSNKTAKAKPATRVIRKVGTPVIQAKPSVKQTEAEEDAVQTATKAAATPVPAPAEDAPAAQADAADTPDIVPSLPDEDVKAFFADAPPLSADQADTDDAEEAPVKATSGTAQAGSIADKLSRIRAVVSQQSDSAEAPDFSEDQHADASVAPSAKMTDDVADVADEEAADKETDVLANTLRDLEDALDTDDQSEAPYTAQDATEESEDNDIAAILSRLDAEADAPADEIADPAPTAELDQSAPADLTSDADDSDADDMDENILAAIGAETVNLGLDDLDDLPKGNIFDDAPAATPAAEAPVEEAPEPVAAKPAPRTRVLKVKRATLDAAIESGQLEEYDDGQDGNAAKQNPSSLSPEAEAELADELAALEADMKATSAAAQQAEEAATQEAEAEQRAEEVAPARAKIKRLADDDLSRLMEESESKMGEPEAATSRDAFSHLRTAVASKKADEAAGGASDDLDTDEAYRDDLASVVRPRRPVAASGAERPRTKRPAEPQPAPLKLVAEQRIDLDQSRGAAPVRPRRVSAMAPKAVTTSEAQASGADSFADFAADMGATQLPDLLEAAAAYLSFVEGLDEFSRPQLMTKVRQVEQENFTREESLRSFGKLLRECKIEKLKGGHFQASDLIGFKPDARATG